MVSADSSGETCPEKKVLYKLISGLHSSISMHIAGDYLLDESRNQVCCLFVAKKIEQQVSLVRADMFSIEFAVGTEY